MSQSSSIAESETNVSKEASTVSRPPIPKKPASFRPKKEIQSDKNDPGSSAPQEASKPFPLDDKAASLDVKADDSPAAAPPADLQVTLESPPQNRAEAKEEEALEEGLACSPFPPN